MDWTADLDNVESNKAPVSYMCPSPPVLANYFPSVPSAHPPPHPRGVHPDLISSCSNLLLPFRYSPDWSRLLQSYCAEGKVCMRSSLQAGVAHTHTHPAWTLLCCPQRSGSLREAVHVNYSCKRAEGFPTSLLSTEYFMRTVFQNSCWLCADDVRSYPQVDLIINLIISFLR